MIAMNIAVTLSQLVILYFLVTSIPYLYSMLSSLNASDYKEPILWSSPNSDIVPDFLALVF